MGGGRTWEVNTPSVLNPRWSRCILEKSCQVTAPPCEQQHGQCDLNDHEGSEEAARDASAALFSL